MIILNGNNLTIKKLIEISLNQKQISICPKNKSKIDEASEFVNKIVEGDNPVYGINTGFGHLSQVLIDKEDLSDLQKNLLMSHACGVGNILNTKTVRAMMALRINALIQGYSGIRYETIKQMVLLLNNNIIPVVYEKGSLGASGDLALLSHMSLPLIGLGEVFYKGEKMSSLDAYKLSGLKPLEKLYPKEGLSLINGTQAMNAIGAIALNDAFKLINLASLSLSLTSEALEGLTSAFDNKVQVIRKQSGQIEIANQLRSILNNSSYSKFNSETKVQDAYSIRCSPQVHGASLTAFKHIKEVVEDEMNAVTDNPLVFTNEDEVISAGNFHGQPLALAFDYLAIAVSELANISERRIERLVNPQLNNGLPPFLTEKSGVNSGFMIVQYTAASLVSENKVLSHPASVDSIPSSANQEDHVSMGSISARKVTEIIKNTYKVIAMEFLTATQALGFKDINKLSPITKNAYKQIRKHIPFIKNDEVMYPHIHKLHSLLLDNEFYNLLLEGVDLVE